MAWNSIRRENIDLKSENGRELYITGHSLIETKNLDEKGKAKRAHKYEAIDRIDGPVEFLATESLAKTMGEKKAVNRLFQIAWRGKKQLKDGRAFNVFQVMEWTGDLPEWTKNPSLINTGFAEEPDEAF